MRVCQPGPEARHRSMTSGGSRKLMSCRGFGARGRPPLLTMARPSISSLSSGRSLYSWGLTTCASTRARSDPKVGREAGLLTVIGLSHAEDVAHQATGGVADDYQSPVKKTVANEPAFTIVLALILHLDGDARKNEQCIVEIKASFVDSLLPLDWIVGETHKVNVSTQTSGCKSREIQNRLKHRQLRIGHQATGGSTRPTVAGTCIGSTTPASSSCIRIMLTSVGTDGRPVSIT